MKETKYIWSCDIIYHYENVLHKLIQIEIITRSMVKFFKNTRDRKRAQKKKKEREKEKEKKSERERERKRERERERENERV